MAESKSLQNAAEDFRYLLNRGFPRKAALELVGNRYQLNADERHLLHRGVFSDEDSILNKARKIPFYQIRDRDLAIDGYNLIITLEAGLSGNYRRSEKTEEALLLIFNALKRVKPRHTLFLFDAPISKSGELAREIRRRLKKEGIPGNAQAMKVPEKILIGFSGVVATTDTAIINRSEKAVDLAGYIIRQRSKPESLIRWRKASDRSRKNKGLMPRDQTK